MIDADPPALVERTKEAAIEAHALGDRRGVTFGGGPALSAFYLPWLGVIGGLTFAPSQHGGTERVETRGGIRLVLPRALFGCLFVYATTLSAVAFVSRQDATPRAYERSLWIGAGGGAFVTVGDALRLRAEIRYQHAWNGSADSAELLVTTLSLVRAFE